MWQIILDMIPEIPVLGLAHSVTPHDLLLVLLLALDRVVMQAEPVPGDRLPEGPVRNVPAVLADRDPAPLQVEHVRVDGAVIVAHAHDALDVPVVGPGASVGRVVVDALRVRSPRGLGAGELAVGRVHLPVDAQRPDVAAAVLLEVAQDGLQGLPAGRV